MMHNIVIVDDHLLIAKALTGIIENFKQYNVLYECDNGKTLQEKMNTKKNIPDIVLLDISMPVMDGFATAAWLTENYPEILIMALSMQDDEQSLIKMVKAGAKGYLLKNVHPIELEKALNGLVKNGSYYPDWATSKVFASISKKISVKQTVNVTEREKEFLQYCVTEMSYKEIAEKMFCSPRTVESYRDSLFEKLDLKTRVGLAVFAMKNGYIA
ncbi:MAG: response regulator transcription factor [Chitinophagaceae bacterium]|nr:response regulator transcription factor [Chitinophagaceae bacterium]MBP6433021.1 response regulator transcription factor [Ferruginibacter sp.]